MKATKEEQLDRVVSKAIQKAAVKSPSNDFTQNVMHTIKVHHVSQTPIVYEPLISKRGWAFLGTAFFLLFGYVSVQNIGAAYVSNFMQETYSTIFSWTIHTWQVSTIDFSIAKESPYVYGALILFGFLLVEIAILKRTYSQA